MTGLGVLWGKGGLLPDRVAPALQALARHGLNRSFRYENQALLPGVAQAHLDALAGAWPDSWRPIWDLIAPGQARPESAINLMIGISALTGLPVEYRTESYGPDHARAATGRLATVTSPQEPTKAQAREYCAARLITLIDILAEDTCLPICQPLSSSSWSRI
jgi:hypothetical protein